MLTKKLPTSPSPPMLSIFWSTPNTKSPDRKCYRKKQIDESTDFISFGAEPDFFNARVISFSGENILVFPHEFSVVDPEKMRLYTNETHDFVPEDVASDMLTNNIEINADNRDIYDSARLDGCTNHQALMTVAGMDITIEDSEFPAIGWYRIKPQYGEIFCNSYEMTEDRRSENQILDAEMENQSK